MSPRTPRPAATGIASANRPMRMTSVVAKHSAALRTGFQRGQRLDLFLDLFLGGARADQAGDAGEVTRPQPGERRQQQQRGRPPRTGRARRSRRAAGSPSASGDADWLRELDTHDCMTTPLPCQAIKAKKPTSRMRPARSSAILSRLGNSTIKRDRCGYARARPAPRPGPRPIRSPGHNPPARRHRRWSA